MSQKHEITKKILTQHCPQYTEKELKTCLRSWWHSQRTKDRGGLRLTREGFDALRNFNYKTHRIRYETLIQFNNEVAVWLDQNIDSPYFVTNREIYVFGERDAIQLALFNGNIPKIIRAKKRFKQKQIDNME